MAETHHKPPNGKRPWAPRGTTLSETRAGSKREAALRNALEREVVEMAEREQRRLARLLHEGLSQQITGTALALKALSRQLHQRGAPETEMLDRIAGMLNDGVSQAHELVRTLCIGSGNQVWLEAALRSLAERTDAKVPCVFQCSEALPEITGPIARGLFRLAQEAVENAVRHAKAGKISISLQTADHHLVLAVLDDGIGFPADTDLGETPGCRMMQHRARMMGAAWRMERPQGGGTLVCCRVPLSK